MIRRVRRPEGVVLTLAIAPRRPVSLDFGPPRLFCLGTATETPEADTPSSTLGAIILCRIRQPSGRLVPPPCEPDASGSAGSRFAAAPTPTEVRAGAAFFISHPALSDGRRVPKQRGDQLRSSDPDPEQTTDRESITHIAATEWCAASVSKSPQPRIEEGEGPCWP